MSIDNKNALSEIAEIQNRGRDFRPYAWMLLQPCHGRINWPGRKKGKIEAATPVLDDIYGFNDVFCLYIRMSYFSDDPRELLRALSGQSIPERIIDIPKFAKYAAGYVIACFRTQHRLDEYRVRIKPLIILLRTKFQPKNIA